MRPFDYKLIHALDTVIQQQSFDKAANILNITQSAISQRIKQLEQLVAQPVLIRTQPLCATLVGEKLLSHFRKVRQLEYDLAGEIVPSDQATAIPINIAVNADTLASWFIPAISPILKKHAIELNIQVSNEASTQELLKKGEVFAAVSSQKSSFAGVKVEAIGTINYVLCASKEFKNKYFKDGLNKQNLIHAPSIDYDARDTMHSDYLKQHFKIRRNDYPCHRIRSSEAVVTMTLAGLAYGLIPTTQANEHLLSGALIDLAPDKHLPQTLYWHSWALERGVQKQISKTIIAYGEDNFIRQS
ncbi:LysR family transcriptional regulator ArgP [Thalassomonas sp. M1454]|uniref:LysR family transcriptional regulator ArgP n=1 Tax=Thalassomonas sp. M1454 TaxID=2594477 RepID=UPI00117D6DB5|nr:LysR family transcriptional regulator ArgP [Thalassomonas sp. M1454]TRX54483.1 LysR family transcriptional regulator ArgP [Thalassomonas sp. M1454]